MRRPRQRGAIPHSRHLNCLVVPLWRPGIIVSASALLLVPLSQSCKTLLLCHGVDVRSNGERDDVEERDPSVLGKELLRKSKGQGGDDPADLHDRHESGLPSRMDLVHGPRAGNDSHREQVHTVLNGSNLSPNY
jgi:hypothetical protein